MDSWTSLSIAYRKQWVIWATTLKKGNLDFLQCLWCVFTNFPQFWQFWGYGVLRGHFLGGWVWRIACCFSFIQGLSNAYNLSPYQALNKPLATQPPPQNPGQITLPDFQWTPGNSPFFLEMVILAYPWLSKLIQTIHGYPSLSRPPPRPLQTSQTPPSRPLETMKYVWQPRLGSWIAWYIKHNHDWSCLELCGFMKVAASLSFILFDIHYIRPYVYIYISNLNDIYRYDIYIYRYYRYQISM